MHDSPPPVAATLAPDWQRVLANAITRPAELLDLLALDPALPALNLERLRGFPLRVPRGFVGKMRRGDPRDPLFLQVWPSAAESIETQGFVADAVGDLGKLKPGGVIHKYAGRALVVATGACAIHCRYCFRRDFPYNEALAARGHWREALDTLAADPTIEEVILSGGDPLALTDDKLATFVAGLESILHVRRLRLHSRLPVVLPERVDARLLGWLSQTRLQKVIVLHANHPDELCEDVRAACNALRATGVTLLNQSVLLRGINDDVDTLTRLSERLLACGVLPYYLHVLDRVNGAAHFEVDEVSAGVLMRSLSARLPGYLVPKLVREVAGESAKMNLPW